VRGRSGVTLTDAGRALLARTRTILGEVHQARAELGALAGVRAGTVRLGSFPTATQAFVGGVLAAFAVRHPGVTVVLVDDEPHHNVARLRDHDLDLALVLGVEGRPIGLDYHGVELAPEEAVRVTPLFEDPYVAVLPEGHPLADAPVTADALAGEVLIGSRGTPGLEELADRCRLNGFRCTDYTTVRALVAAGQGVAVLPALATTHPLAGTVVRRFEGWAPRRRVGLARPADGVLSPAAAAVADVISAYDRGE
jgi:DNA-binding transcriptional LysR family regulator